MNDDGSLRTWKVEAPALVVAIPPIDPQTPSSGRVRKLTAAPIRLPRILPDALRGQITQSPNGVVARLWAAAGDRSETTVDLALEVARHVCTAVNAAGPVAVGDVSYEALQGPHVAGAKRPNAVAVVRRESDQVAHITFLDGKAVDPRARVTDGHNRPFVPLSPVLFLSEAPAVLVGSLLSAEARAAELARALDAYADAVGDDGTPAGDRADRLPPQIAAIWDEVIAAVAQGMEGMDQPFLSVDAAEEIAEHTEDVVALVRNLENVVANQAAGAAVALVGTVGAGVSFVQGESPLYQTAIRSARYLDGDFDVPVIVGPTGEPVTPAPPRCGHLPEVSGPGIDIHATLALLKAMPTLVAAVIRLASPQRDVEPGLD